MDIFEARALVDELIEEEKLVITHGMTINYKGMRINMNNSISADPNMAYFIIYKGGKKYEHTFRHESFRELSDKMFYYWETPKEKRLSWKNVNKVSGQPLSLLSKIFKVISEH